MIEYNSLNYLKRHIFYLFSYAPYLFVLLSDNCILNINGQYNLLSITYKIEYCFVIICFDKF